MSTLSPAQIYAYARGAGLSAAAATTATAVALAESGGKTDNLGDQGIEDAKWGPSVGLWQIRSLKAQSGTGQIRDAEQLTSPAFNAASMAAISGMGSNFNAWTTFKNGTYKSDLPQVSSTVPGAVVIPTSSSSSSSSGSSSGSGSVASGMTGLFGVEGDLFTVGLKVLGAAAAAGLVIVGAVHTVSDK